MGSYHRQIIGLFVVLIIFLIILIVFSVILRLDIMKLKDHQQIIIRSTYQSQIKNISGNVTYSLPRQSEKILSLNTKLINNVTITTYANSEVEFVIYDIGGFLLKENSTIHLNEIFTYFKNFKEKKSYIQLEKGILIVNTLILSGKNELIIHTKDLALINPWGHFAVQSLKNNSSLYYFSGQSQIRPYLKDITILAYQNETDLYLKLKNILDMTSIIYPNQHLTTSYENFIKLEKVIEKIIYQNDYTLLNKTMLQDMASYKISVMKPNEPEFITNLPALNKNPITSFAELEINLDQNISGHLIGKTAYPGFKYSFRLTNGEYQLALKNPYVQKIFNVHLNSNQKIKLIPKFEPLIKSIKINKKNVSFNLKPIKLNSEIDKYQYIIKILPRQMFGNIYWLNFDKPRIDDSDLTLVINNSYLPQNIFLALYSPLVFNEDTNNVQFIRITQRQEDSLVLQTEDKKNLNFYIYKLDIKYLKKLKIKLLFNNNTAIFNNYVKPLLFLQYQPVYRIDIW